MSEPAATHLDLDALADALAGEGDADGRAHLAQCAACTSRLAELDAAEASVTAALRALPDPVLPDRLAERLAAALAAEPPLAGAQATVTALPEAGRRSRRRAQAAPRTRWLPAAAAAVLLVCAGGLGYGLVSGTGAGDESADTAGTAGGGSAADLVLSSSGTDYADTEAVAAALPAVLAGSAETFALDSAAGALAAPEAAPEASPGAAAGATGSEAARSSAALPAPPPAGADPLERLRTPAGLEECLSAVLPPDEPGLRPRALDYATYGGRPALAILLPDPDPAKLSVYVVGPQCAAQDAQLLGFFRLDAP